MVSENGGSRSLFADIERMAGPLPRNPNGKIDRKLLSTGWVERLLAVRFRTAALPAVA